MAASIASVAVAAAAHSAADDVAEKLHQELGWNKPVTKAAIHAGSATIGVSGAAAAGAAIGSVVPVVGTAIGAAVGGIAGAIGSIFRIW